MIYDAKSEFVNVDGQIVERDALRIAEAIQTYDSNLVLLCLDPDRMPDISDAPFVVAERDSAGVLHPMFKAWTLDDNLLHRIYLADQQRIDGWKRLLDLEEEQKKKEQNEIVQQKEVSNDIVKHVLADRKSRFTYRDDRTDEKVTIYDDRPPERH